MRFLWRLGTTTPVSEDQGGAPCILAVYPGNYARTFLSILARILARILAVGILGILVILGVRILGILANCSQHSEEPFNGQYRPPLFETATMVVSDGLDPAVVDDFYHTRFGNELYYFEDIV